MSKANSPIKVLRTALNRVEKGWTKSTWHFYNPEDGQNYVCLEGAVYGYCNSDKHSVTEAQHRAIRVLRQIIRERFGIYNIPQFNDAENTTKENVMEVIKLGIIRLESDGEMTDEEFEALLRHKETRT